MVSKADLFGFQVGSFLFKIEPLHPDFSLEQPQTNCHGCWDPPNTSAEYTRESGSLYRWQGGQAYAVPPGDNERQIGLEAFRAATVFTQWPKDVHLLAVNYDVKQTPRTSRIHWRTLSFDHRNKGPTNHYLPYVNPEALHFHLPAPDTDRWVSQLLPCCYVSPQNQDAGGHRIEPTKFNDGLVGKLPVLIALAVFSAPKDQMNQVLTNCLQPNHWRPHNFVSGRDYQYRGIIVTVYLDPMNPETSTAEYLTQLEDGEFGPFYGPEPTH